MYLLNVSHVPKLSLRKLCTSLTKPHEEGECSNLQARLHAVFYVVFTVVLYCMYSRVFAKDFPVCTWLYDAGTDSGTELAYADPGVCRARDGKGDPERSMMNEAVILVPNCISCYAACVGNSSKIEPWCYFTDNRRDPRGTPRGTESVG